MVKLEPFSEHRYGSLVQAQRLKSLVTKERDWLEFVQPGTVMRYESARRGAHNIRRIAGQRKGWYAPLEANIIRRGHAAIGIATIIPAQEIIHPDEGALSGNDIDYWLKEKYSDDVETHKEVTRSLLGAYCGHTIIATIVEGHPNPPIGFRYTMRPIGQPANLSPGDREDTYDVAREGRSAQLYALSWPNIDHVIDAASA